MDQSSLMCGQAKIGLSQEAILRALLASRTSLLGYIWSMVRDPHVVEDIFQEVSVLAMEKRGEFASEKPLPTWLRRTARFQVLAHFRDAQRKPPMLSTATFDVMDRDWEEDNGKPSGDTINALHLCLAELAPAARRLLTLRYNDGLAGTEVAEVVGRKVGSVYTALSRVHSRLRDCMLKRLSQEGANA